MTLTENFWSLHYESLGDRGRILYHLWHLVMGRLRQVPGSSVSSNQKGFTDAEGITTRPILSAFENCILSLFTWQGKARKFYSDKWITLQCFLLQRHWVTAVFLMFSIRHWTEHCWTKNIGGSTTQSREKLFFLPLNDITVVQKFEKHRVLSFYCSQ